MTIKKAMAADSNLEISKNKLPIKYIGLLKIKFIAGIVGLLILNLFTFPGFPFSCNQKNMQRSVDQT